jgi:PAS domain S-box-containing protein
MRDVEDINRTLKEELCMTDRALEEFGKHVIKVFNYMSIGVLTTDPKGVITTLNRKAVELLGLGAGDNIVSIIGKEVVDRFGIDMEEIAMDVGFKKRVLNVELSPLPVKPNWQILVCARDVTLERLKERDLLRVQDQYKDIIENAIDAMYILRNGRLILINKKLQDILGYEAEELLDKHYRHFVTRASLKILSETVRPSRDNAFIPNLEIQTKRRDGKILNLEISIGRLMVGKDQCYVGMVRDITSKKELLALKTRFLHVASHEIRVPLTVIRGYARMLGKDNNHTLSTSQHECIQEIEKHCEKLLNFSHSLLDFARINSGRMALSRQKVDLFYLIRRVIHDMQIKSDEMGVSIVLESQDSIPAAFVDPLRIEQALNNIIDNAIKHSPEGGVVTVRLSLGENDRGGIHMILNQESAQIAILDQGPGVKSEEAKDLFNEFFVGMSGKSKRGIGLGLAITKEIVHAHGGYIEARPSENGGIFIITIPLNSPLD